MPALAAIGIVTRDMKESVRFYRLLGIDVADAADDHLDATLPSGIRLMWDTLELTKQLDPDWVDPKGHRMGSRSSVPRPERSTRLTRASSALVFARRRIRGTRSGVSATRRSSTPTT